MKNFIIVTVLLLMSVGFLFADQPKLKEAKLEPAVLESGDKIKVSVEFTGSKDDIKEVTILVREYVDEAPQYSLAPDAASKKNVWILEETVPYDAPIGIIHLDITAIDKDGKKIVTKDLSEATLGSTATLKLEVKY
jgi:hypothetical protein